jgi:hypothetical protein
MAIGKKTGGRTKGTPNQASVRHKDLARRAVHMVLDTGITPLDVLCARMRDEVLPNGRKVSDEQFAAAVAAAPYIHPKLAATVTKDISATPTSPSAIDSRVLELLMKGSANVATLESRTIAGRVVGSDASGED